VELAPKGSAASTPAYAWSEGEAIAAWDDTSSGRPKWSGSISLQSYG
jgi:hypothetical protein